MTDMLPYLAALAVIGAMVLASGVRVQARTVALHGLLVAAVLVSAVHVMGRPKPFWTEITPTDEIEVVSAQYHPGIGIYIWVRSSPPVQYALPWDVGLAREMQEAIRYSGGAILTVGETNSGQWQAHPLPQLPSPAKEVE